MNETMWKAAEEEASKYRKALKKVRQHILDGYGCYPQGGPGESKQSNDFRAALEAIDAVL